MRCQSDKLVTDTAVRGGTWCGWRQKEDVLYGMCVGSFSPVGDCCSPRRRSGAAFSSFHQTPPPCRHQAAPSTVHRRDRHCPPARSARTRSEDTSSTVQGGAAGLWWLAHGDRHSPRDLSPRAPLQGRHRLTRAAGRPRYNCTHHCHEQRIKDAPHAENRTENSHVVKWDWTSLKALEKVPEFEVTPLSDASGTFSGGTNEAGFSWWGRQRQCYSGRRGGRGDDGAAPTRE